MQDELTESLVAHIFSACDLRSYPYDWGTLEFHLLHPNLGIQGLEVRTEMFWKSVRALGFEFISAVVKELKQFV